MDTKYVGITKTDLIVHITELPKETIQKIIETFDIGTQIIWTDRGAQLWYKLPKLFKGSKKVCPLGFYVEFEYIKNEKDISIKRNVRIEKIQNEDVRENLPEFLYSRNNFDSLVGLEEGDGRNQAIFKHRGKIEHLSEWQTMMRFINNHIFAEPLDDKELQTLLRDDLKKRATKDAPEESMYATEIMEQYKVVKYDDHLYFNLNGKYLNDRNKLNRLVFSEVGHKKTWYVEEIIKQMEYRSPLVDESKTFDIKLGNGILRDGRFIEVDFQEFTPFHIDIKYSPDAEPVQEVDDYIDLLTNNDPNYRQLLFEILAYTLIVNKEFKRLLAKFFIFVGDGGNGKGTLLTIIRKILGDKNVTGLSVKDISDERYFVTMKGKLANLGDDIQDEPINHQQMKLLKNISTCDFIATRELFKQSQNVEMTTSLIFTSNHILKSFEKGESYKRRVMWLPMYSKPKKKDKNFISKITTKEALEYWLKLILEGYFRLYKNDGFTESETVKKFNDEYHEENNGILLYLEDHTKDDFIGLKPPSVYKEYETWAEENGMTVHSKRLFSNSIKDKFGLVVKSTKISGESARVYKEIETE